MLKTLFWTFLSFLPPPLAFAQSKSPYESIKLENSQVFFEKVYFLDSLSAANIERLLVGQMPRVKNLKGFTKSEGIITAISEDCTIDYKKYGGKWGNTLLYLNHPFFATVSIVWKDGKYKVSMNNMEWHAAGVGTATSTDVFTKWERARTGICRRFFLKGGEYVDRYFSDLFAAKNSIKDDW